VIYNGINLTSNSQNNQANSQALRDQIYQKLSVSQTSRLLLTVGRLAPQKGYLDLIPVIPHIVREFPDVRFVWAGEGQQRQELVSKLREYDIEDKVLLLGYRSDVPSLLKASNLFVFPTHYEGGQSWAIAEAMAYGLPIVCSNASGIPEVIENHVHGLLFKKEDSCDLLETLRWALRHPDQMQEMAENAKLRIKDFSEDKMVKETLEILQKLAKTTK
jgi:glycosyltransferase involved in cell wall biosynthesis